MSFLRKLQNGVRNNFMTCLTMLSVVIAIFVGSIVRKVSADWSARELMYLEFPGEVFLRALKCLVVPIMISSLVSSLANLEASVFKRIGRYACVYYLGTTTVSIMLGITLVLLIRPGVNLAGDDLSENANLKIAARNATTADTMLDLIRNLVPTNPFEATMKSTETQVIFEYDSVMKKGIEKITIQTNDTTNIMGIVVMSIILGLCLASMGEKATPLKNFFTSLNTVIMAITVAIIKFTPVGVFFLILPRVISVKDVHKLFDSVAWYTLTILLGLFIQASLLLPLIYLVITRKNPYKVILSLSAALFAAFGTSSSTATLPITMNCLEEKLALDSRVVRTLIPIGSVINMDGTALYEAVAAIFVAQHRNIEMDFIKIIITSITATAASVGAAGIPQAGLVTMVIVLNALGLPASDISLIIMVDWFLDRFRTVVNVLGDSFGAAVVYDLCKDSLNDMEDKDEGKETYLTSEQRKRNNLSLNTSRFDHISG